MDEVRRFLRYTLPGLSAVIQLIIGLSITDSSIVCSVLSAKDLAESIGIVLTIFIGSGGLGYLFANIYFSLYWSWPFSRLIAIDHLTLFKDLSEKMIEIVDFSGKAYSKELSKREAWTVFTQYWHSKIEENTKIKGVNTITNRLTDVTHGLGATYIGSLLALVSWVVIHLSISHNLASIISKESLFAFLAWIILIIILGRAYHRTNLALQSIANTTLTDSITKEYQAGNKIKIYYHK